MLSRIRGRLTFANVMSVVAVFIALGGTTYAVTKLPRNSVGPKQIKANAVGTSEAMDDALTGQDISEGTLGQVPSAQSASSAQTASNAETANTANSAQNADQLDNLNATDFLRSNGKAVDADALDGKDQSAFLGKTEMATDSDMLDSIDSTGFIQGRGLAQRNIEVMGPGQSSFGGDHTIGSFSNGLTLVYECPSTLTNQGTLSILNRSPDPVNMFSDNGSGNPTYQVIPGTPPFTPPSRFTQSTNGTGEFVTFQVNRGNSIVTIWVFSVHRSTDCLFQWQSLLSESLGTTQ